MIEFDIVEKRKEIASSIDFTQHFRSKLSNNSIPTYINSIPCGI